jgi:hypothetical protein
MSKKWVNWKFIQNGKCNEPECTSYAQGETHKCIKHGGGTRCEEPECTTMVSNCKTKCVKHGGGKRCNVPECTTTVAIGKNQRKCIFHGGGKRCNEIECTTPVAVACGIKQTKCKKHGGGKRCNEPECTKSASGAKSASGITDKCVKHGGGKRCVNCVSWVYSHGAAHNYDGYCIRCFKHEFPEDDRSAKMQSVGNKETLVRNCINSNFKGFLHNIPLFTGNCACDHKRRIDHRKLINGTLLAIETDELGHANYNTQKEEIRYDDLFMIHSGKWIFIRFNPDDNDGNDINISDKLDELINTMHECIERIERDENTELIEIIKLYC